MELRHLHYFVAVAEELHFRRAAERLHMSQPPLSQQIRALETELGVVLLDRSRRQVELTAAGAAFYERARDILRSVDDATRLVRRVHRGEVGRLAVGFVGSSMYSVVPDVLGAFTARYESVDLHLRELSTTAQLRQLENGQIDVGFIRPLSDRSGLVIETVRREPVVVALPESHRLAARERLDLEDLAGESLVLLGREDSPGVRDALRVATERLGGDVQEVREIQTVIGLVRAGVGISLVPASLRALTREGVAYRELDGDEMSIELAIAWRAGDRSPVLAAFRELTHEFVGGEERTRRPPPGRMGGRGPAPQ